MRFILCLYKIDCCFKMRKLELARVLCLAFLIKERLTFFKKNINTHIYINISGFGLDCQCSSEECKEAGGTKSEGRK